MITLTTPISEEEIAALHVGDTVEISGYILCGRDAVLPKVVDMIEAAKPVEAGGMDAEEGLGTNDGEVADKVAAQLGVDLRGQVVFHTAVSPAGVGPTSSNKAEIEASIAPLSAAGVKVHLGKGKLKDETVQALAQNNSVYAVIPPVTALLGARTLETKVVAFPELGMEALHLIKVDRFPAIIGAAHGRSIYDQDE